MLFPLLLLALGSLPADATSQPIAAMASTQRPVTPAQLTNSTADRCASAGRADKAESCSETSLAKLTGPASGKREEAGSGMAPQGSPVSIKAVSLGQNANLNGFQPFPGSSVYQDKSGNPVDTEVNKAFQATYATVGLHPDFIKGGDFPYWIYDSSQTPNLPLVATKCDTEDQDPVKGYRTPYSGYCTESDDTKLPVIPAAAQEGGTDMYTCWKADGDHHTDFLDRATGWLDSLYQNRACDGLVLSYNHKVWDVLKPFEGQSPNGRTTTDAAGLPTWSRILGVNQEEIDSGEIRHALRITFHQISAAYYRNGNPQQLFSYPASHAAPSNGGPYAAIEGAFICLRPDFDMSGYSRTNRIILTAMQKYCVIIADRGSPGFFQGTYSPKMNFDDLVRLGAVKMRDFRVIQTSPRISAELTPEDAKQGASVLHDQTGINNPSGGAGKPVKNAPPVPTITNFSASAKTVAAGSPITFSATAKNATVMFIDNARPIRDTLVFYPERTQTYTLTAEGPGGYRVSSALTVTVTGTTIADPVPSVAPGTYKSAQSLSFPKPVSGAAYHYTADGTLATCESPALTGPISLAGHQNHINVQVIGCGPGLIRSHLVSLHYTMDVPVTHGVVQSAAAVQSAPGTPITVALPIAPKAGNRLYAFLSSGADKYAGTITAPPGMSLIAATQVDGLSKLSVYTTTSLGSGSYTFSTSGNHARMSVAVLEVAGTSGVDKYSTASKIALSNGMVIRTTGAVTPSVVGDIAVAAFAGASAGSEHGPP
ncbi:MAG: chitobiase/beta-hexosaminidase C-terminal domain-containing protein, partial [Janthinobacterium lividum]